MPDPTTRRGKIARLPLPIREELNLRIQNGAIGRDLIDWLNSLPETVAILADQFDGQPISECNLSAWRLGGYRDWEAKHETFDILSTFCASDADLSNAASLTNTLALHLAARIAAAFRDLDNSADSANNLETIAQLCRHVALLRRGDQEAQWLQLQREKHQEAVQKNNPEPKQSITMEDIKLIERRLNLFPSVPPDP